jgi:GNAT superfamily N-acetyltransferase
MRVEVSQEPITALAEYARIPIAFEVREVFDVETKGEDSGSFVLTARSLDAPYLKDYDAIEGGAPPEWARRFDLSSWALFAARVEGRRVGGAAVALDASVLNSSEAHRDSAILWDVRVSPEERGRGVGTALFRAAEAWAIARGCRQLLIETQNINVGACKFYARQGCTLAAAHRMAYPGLPNEIQLLWYKDLASGAAPAHGDDAS